MAAERDVEPFSHHRDVADRRDIVDFGAFLARLSFAPRAIDQTGAVRQLEIANLIAAQGRPDGRCDLEHRSVQGDLRDKASPKRRGARATAFLSPVPLEMLAQRAIVKRREVGVERAIEWRSELGGY